LSINANAASVVCETMRWGHRCGRRSASATSKLVILRSGEVTNLATDLYRGRSLQCAAAADDVVIGYAMRLTRSGVVRCWNEPLKDAENRAWIKTMVTTMMIRRSVRLAVAAALTLGSGAACGDDEVAADKGTASVTFGTETFDFNLTVCRDGLAEGIGEHPRHGPIRLVVRDLGTIDSLWIVRAKPDEDGPGWFYTNDPAGTWGFTLDERGSVDADGLPIYEFDNSQSIPGYALLDNLERLAVARLVILCSPSAG